MSSAVIQNPILNSPYHEPERHFLFDEDGITDRVVESRRISTYFVPIPPPKKKNKQLGLETEWTADRIKENKFINDIRRAGVQQPAGEMHLILEVTGQRDAKKDAKVATARNLWVPAVNHHGTFEKWAFLEITDPWNAKQDIRAFLDNEQGARL